MSSKESSSEIKSILDKRGALREFESLVKAGCDPDELENALESFKIWQDNSWKNLIGMDLRKFKQAIAQIRHVASLIERLNSSNLILDLSGIARDPYFKNSAKPNSFRSAAKVCQCS